MNRMSLKSIAALCAIICLFALPTAAQQTNSPFLVLNSERVATEPKALQDLYAEIDAAMLRQAVGHNMALDALEAEYAPVIEAKKTLTEEEYQTALNEFNTGAAQLEAALVEAEQGINQAAEEALARFNALRVRLENEMLANYGAQRFIDSSAVLYSRPGMDLDKTDALIASLDAAMPTLSLDAP